MARYKIWKASIEEYRVLDTKTNKTKVMTEFAAFRCTFKVDLNKYDEAKAKDFKNSGVEDDYFAHIEAENIVETPIIGYCDRPVWYNPFLHTHFRDRLTKDVVNSVGILEVKGNTLKYNI